MVKSGLFLVKNKEKKLIQCLACSHKCVIEDGKSGICGVRKNDNMRLELLVYAKPIAAHVDPIEKKPLYRFLPNTNVYSIGTVGCNFRCSFCQNWDISQSSKNGFIDGEDLSSESTSSGAYLISDVPSGTYSISFTRTGFVSQTINDIEVKGDLTTTVAAVELLIE